MPEFTQNQILAINLYNWREIENNHTIEQDLNKINHLYKTGDSCYQHNCQRAVMAYEARRRGYDVYAKPYLYRDTDTLIYDDIEKGWPSVFKNPKIIKLHGNSVEDIKGKIDRKLLDWGEGARTVIAVDFKNQEDEGHVFIAEVENGIVKYVDPQTADMNVESYFKDINPKEVILLRMDKLEFTNKIKECCGGYDT